MSRAKKLVGETIVLAFGTLGGRVVGILLLPVYTRALSPSQFGTVDLVVTTVDLVIPLLYLCISEAVLRYAMLRQGSPEDVLRTGLAFSLAISSVVLLLGMGGSVWVTSQPVALVGAILATQAICLVLGAWARAVGGVRPFAVSGLVQAATVAVSNLVFLVKLELGVSGFLISLLVGNVMAALVLASALPVVPAWRQGSWNPALLRTLLSFSAPLVPNVVMWWLTNISGRYFLLFFGGVEQVGIFGVASRFPTIITMLTTVFAQAWQLSANRSADEVDRGAFYSRTFRVYAAVLLLMTSAILVFLKPLMGVIAAPEYFDAWKVVPILLAGAVFAAFASFYGTIYTAAKVSRGVFKTSIFAGVLALVLNALLVPRGGVIGAAMSIMLCFLGLWVLRVFDSQALTATSVSPRLVLPAFVILGAQVALCYLPIGDALDHVILTLPGLLLAWLFRQDFLEFFQGGFMKR